MAWPPERPARAPAGPDHVGRHRHTRARDVGATDTTDGGGGRASDDLEPDQRSGDGPEGSGTEAQVVPLFSVPDSLRSVDVAVGGRAVRGLLLVTVVLLLTLGGRWWWVSQQAAGAPVEQVVGSGPQQVPGPQGTAAGNESGDEVGARPAEGEHPPDGGTASAAPAAATPPPGADPEPAVLVHVVGQVHEPGVVELPSGSRVVDAVNAAGGLTDEADPESLNLARPVVDGEQVWVGAPGEEPPPWLQVQPVPPAAGAGGGTGGPGAGQPGDGAGGDGGQGTLVVDLNLADQALLEELPGVGPVTAGNILAWRDQHGRFTAVEELMEVSGIGEKTFEQLRPHVTVSG